MAELCVCHVDQELLRNTFEEGDNRSNFALNLRDLGALEYVVFVD